MHHPREWRFTTIAGLPLLPVHAPSQGSTCASDTPTGKIRASYPEISATGLKVCSLV